MSWFLLTMKLGEIEGIIMLSEYSFCKGSSEVIWLVGLIYLVVIKDEVI